MRVLQIAIALFGILVVLLLFLLIDAHGELDVLRQQARGNQGESPNRGGSGEAGGGTADGSPRSGGGVAYEADAAELRQQLDTLSQQHQALEARSTGLTAENERLQSELRRVEQELELLRGSQPGGRPGPGVPTVDPEAPRPFEGDLGQTRREAVELAQRLDLDPYEQAQVEAILVEGRARFADAMERLKGADPAELEGVALQLIEDVKQEIQEVLPPEKAERFDRYVQAFR